VERAGKALVRKTSQASESWFLGTRHAITRQQRKTITRWGPPQSNSRNEKRGGGVATTLEKKNIPQGALAYSRPPGVGRTCVLRPVHPPQLRDERLPRGQGPLVRLPGGHVDAHLVGVRRLRVNSRILGVVQVDKVVVQRRAGLHDWRHQLCLGADDTVKHAPSSFK